jgi:hypothetical protein
MHGPGHATAADFFSYWAQSDPDMVQVLGGIGEYVDGKPYEVGYFTDWFGRNIGNFQIPLTVWGRSDFEVILKGISNGIAKIAPHTAEAAADIASNFPGVGTAVAAAITFLAEVGRGASVENASLAAGRSAVPSSLRAAYDLGVGLATQGELDVEAALKVGMAMAISEGVISGDILEKYQTIKSAYEDAREIGAGIDGLGTTVSLAV